jgi:hypothetical protein
MSQKVPRACFLTFVYQSYLPASLTGGTTASTAESAQGGPGNNEPSGGVGISSAPLESGPHTVDNPNPASEVHARQVGVNESK